MFKQKYAFLPTFLLLTFVLMRYLFLLLLLTISSCGSDEPQALKKPDDLIPEEAMVQVLADVHMLEAAITIRNPGPRNPINMNGDPSVVPVIENTGKHPLAYYDIFKKYNLTRDQYEKTMAWYTANPVELNAIYDKVLVELTKRQVEMQAGK